MSLSPTPRSTIRRGKDRAVPDRTALYEVLDAGLVCHLAFVADGSPVVLPTGYGRDGDTLYVHGSTGAKSLRTAMADTEVCVNVTLLDGVVYSRAVFHFSMNYRSAVIHGRARQLESREERLAALRTITEHIAPGSWDYAREPDQKELAATAVLALSLGEAAVKIRTGPPGDDEDDHGRGTWAGVLPLHQRWGTPEDCPELLPGETVPPHVHTRPHPT